MTGFRLEATDGAARTGTLLTPHGDVRTPAFMPVATLGSVKGLDPEDLRRLETDIVLANAYHLYLRPGVDVVEDLGGLHSFMGWHGPLLTDSGGFQGFSLQRLREITEDGIDFRSHIDGSMHRFTPEASIEYQERLGADVIMPLDVCAPADASQHETEAALERTNRWAERCLRAHARTDQMLFGIVQGGTSPDLRQRSVEFLTSLGFPGYAIGGLSVGEPKSVMYETTGLTARMLPPDRPRYLMGVGSPEDLVECVARGTDMFDCVLPTRIARNGALFARSGRGEHRQGGAQDERGACRAGLWLLHVPHLLRGVRSPSVQVEGAARLPAGHHSQPHVRAEADGGDAGGHRARSVRVVPRGVPRAVRAARRGRQTRAEGPVVGGAAETPGPVEEAGRSAKSSSPVPPTPAMMSSALLSCSM